MTSDPRLSVSLQIYRCYDDGRRMPVPLSGESSQTASEISPSALDGTILPWRVARLAPLEPEPRPNLRLLH